MKKYFIFSDAHGFYDELIDALGHAGFDKNNPEHIIISCGDLIDRGDSPRKCLNFVNDLYKKNRAILIRGNHESLMDDLLLRGFPYYCDITNGTVNTLGQMFPKSDNNKTIFEIVEGDDLWDSYKNKLVDYYETDNYIFTHSWIPVDDAADNNAVYNNDWRTGDWEAARWVNSFEYNRAKLNRTGKIIVSGHWHCSAGWTLNIPERFEEFPDKNNSEAMDRCFQIYRDNTLIGLDACTAYTHKVNILVLGEDEL